MAETIRISDIHKLKDAYNIDFSKNDHYKIIVDRSFALKMKKAYFLGEAAGKPMPENQYCTNLEIKGLESDEAFNLTVSGTDGIQTQTSIIGENSRCMRDHNNTLRLNTVLMSIINVAVDENEALDEYAGMRVSVDEESKKRKRDAEDDGELKGVDIEFNPYNTPKPDADPIDPEDERNKARNPLDLDEPAES